MVRLSVSGCTGGIPAKRGGISIIALLMSTGYRVQIPGERFESESLCLQWDSPASGEGIEDGRRPVGEASVDLGAGLRQHVGVVGVLPYDQPFEDPEQALPLGFLLCGCQCLVCGGVVDQRCPDHRASCRERSARPPKMQRRRMSVAE